MFLQTSKESSRLELAGLSPQSDATHNRACLLKAHLSQSVTQKVVCSQRHYVVLVQRVPRESRTFLANLYPGFSPRVSPGRTKSRLHRPAMVRICELVSVLFHLRT